MPDVGNPTMADIIDYAYQISEAVADENETTVENIDPESSWMLVVQLADRASKDQYALQLAMRALVAIGQEVAGFGQ